MGKKWGKNKNKIFNKKGKDNNNNKKEGNYEAFITDNVYYKNYYRRVIASDFSDEDEFNQFYDILKVVLPTTFRVNSSCSGYQEYIQMQTNDTYMNENFFSQKIDDEEKSKAGSDQFDDISLAPVSWYPEGQAYELNASRMMLKKSPGLKKLQDWIRRATDCGLITRQELVSMIPPLLLDPSKDDLIFDMCAAPGSKTSQLLEMLYHDYNKSVDQKSNSVENSSAFIKGAVVCNDVDAKRAHLLTHQVKRINTSAMMVTNHAGQLFPSLVSYSQREDKPEYLKKEKVFFDKVLVDVPCSGDGAIRKLPQKWKKWSNHEGMSLHNLQISLLIRAINMTKVGGTIVYSTCSLNPIENEAVLAEVLKKSENMCGSGTLELIDAHEKLKGFKGRRGLHSWPVMTIKSTEKTDKELLEDDKEYKPEDLFNIYTSEHKNTEEVLTNLKIKSSMFPDEVTKMRDIYKIHNSIRVLPHDQNTGGFFVGIIKKHKDTSKLTSNDNSTTNINNIEQEILSTVIENNDSVDANLIQEEKHVNSEEMIEEKSNASQENKKKNKKGGWISFCEESPEDWKNIKEYYGIENFPSERLFIQKKGDKIVSFVNTAISDILKNDRKNKITVVFVGIKMFERLNSNFHKEVSLAKANDETQKGCYYRPLQSAIDTVWPFMTKRKVKVTLNEFLYLAYNQSIAFKDLDQSKPNIHKIMEEIEMGCFAICCETDKGVKEFLVAQKMKASLVVMASKEHIEGLKVKYEVQIKDMYNNL